MMVVLSLFPSGILQMHDVITNGYWHARSLAYTAGTVPRLLEWLRMPGDLVFIFLGALPIAIALLPWLSRTMGERASTAAFTAGFGGIAGGCSLLAGAP